MGAISQKHVPNSPFDIIYLVYYLWFGQWLGNRLMTSDYLNHWWPDFCHYMVLLLYYVHLIQLTGLYPEWSLREIAQIIVLKLLNSIQIIDSYV